MESFMSSLAPLRAAFVAAALAATVLAPAGAAFATGSTPTPQTGTTQSGTPDNGSTQPGAPGSSATQPATPESGDSESEQPSDGTLIRTVQLKGGLTGQVFRNGDQHIYYTANILKGTKQLGTLQAGGGYALTDTKVFDGISVTLTFEGEISSVEDAGSPGQGPETPSGVLVSTVKLQGGLTAKVYKHEDPNGYYTAWISQKGEALGELNAGHGFEDTESKVFKGFMVTLTSSGRVFSTAVDGIGSPGQGSDECTVTETRNIGAGTNAVMTISPDGPSVTFKGAGDSAPSGPVLDRLHPKLSAIAFAEIINPSSSHPQLRATMQGGGYPSVVLDFPRLPSGCSFTYSTGSTTTTVSATSTSQTTVVPQGSVAAGIEGAPHGGGSMLVPVGGAAAVAAAGLGFVVLRRRQTAGRTDR
jgi:hypothetical protein